MMVIWHSLSYAWHSLTRNLRRSLITIFAVALGTFAMIFLQGAMYGMIRNNISSFTAKTMGKVQAHTEKYLDEGGLYHRLPADYVTKVMGIAKTNNIGAAARSMGGGLVAFKQKSNGGLFMGVDPVVEQKYFTLSKSVMKGRYLSTVANHEVVLGVKLASLLGVDVGQEVVVIVSASDGSMGNDVYKVVGIFGSVGEGFDETAFVFHKDDYANLFSTNNFIHEIAFTSKDNRSAPQLYQTLSKSDPVEGKQYLKTWKQLNPTLGNTIKNMGGFINIFVYIFALASAIGVLNTMLMASKERVREFGMLEAIGTTRIHLFLYTAFEGLFIGLIGAIIGAIIATFGLLFMIYHGIDLAPFLGGSGVNVMGMSISHYWYGDIRFSYYTLAIPLMFILSFLSSLYPSLKVMRINVIEALRTNE